MAIALNSLRAFAALALAAGLSACGQAEDAPPAQSAPDREAIEEIVRGYILENPEIIEEALVELRVRAQERERRQMAEAVRDNAQALIGDPDAPTIGSPLSPLTIVEFFDYRCSFCHVTNEWLVDVLETHGQDVRVVFKEFPVLGAQSREAAQASMAVWRTQPDAYLDFHNALMASSGPLPSERIDSIAAEACVVGRAPRAALLDEAIDAHTRGVRALASEIGITGTPFFIIGDQIIPGADIARLQDAVETQLGG